MKPVFKVKAMAVIQACLALAAGVTLLLLNGCSSVNPHHRPDGPPAYAIDVSRIHDAVPKPEPRSRYGNPASYVVGSYRYHVLKSARGYDKVGYASWYGTKFQHRLTSTREPYNLYSMTAASTILPLPTFVRVTNLKNGRSVIVKVNDRGPFRSNRIIDLSYAAAVKLGYANNGTALVRVTALDPDTWHKDTQQPRTYYAQQRAPEPQQTRLVLDAEKAPVAVTTAPETGIYLQVGAFTQESAAAQLKQRITEILHTPVNIIQTAHNANQLLYKVHVGPLRNPAESQEIREQLLAHGFGNALVVKG